MDKLQCIQTMKQYSVVKIHKLELYETTWINLKKKKEFAEERVQYNTI